MKKTSMGQKIAAAALASAGLAAAADLPNFSVTVQNGSSVGIEGVAVQVAGFDTTFYTDANGLVSCTSSSSGLAGAENRTLRVSVTGRRVRLAGVSDYSGYTLDAYLINGRRVAQNLAFTDGVATLPQMASQMMLFKVRRNGTAVSSWTGSSTAACRKAGSGYTLTFTKAGYFTDSLTADSGALTGLSKLMYDTAAWVPASLEHSGNQVLIKARGYSFAMGSTYHTGEDDDDFENESPVHMVSFSKDFWMDTTEVTQKLYDSVMTKHYGSYTALTWTTDYGKGDGYAAYGITSFGAAVLFANARSVLDGYDSVYTYTARDGVSGTATLTGLTTDTSKNGYRIPTEAEWEYAARGGSSADYYWGGNYISSLTDSAIEVFSKYVVWSKNSMDNGLGEEGYGSHAVASLLPNAYGLHDMLGNVLEWTSDYVADYDSSRQIDPQGPASGSTRSLRGGNWANGKIDYLRAADRHSSVGSLYAWIVDGLRTVRTAR